jgi:hypothetical protein
MACLLYGAGLRVLECCHLRVQDIDFAANQIVVRGGKGDKDRATMLPVVVKSDLASHLAAVRVQHQADLTAGAGWVELPTALLRKYPNAGREWVWQWVLPGPPDRTASPPSPTRVGLAEGGEGRRPALRHRQAGEPSHAPPLVRDPPAGGRA